MLDPYLCTLDADALRDRIAMADEWIARKGNDGINRPVSVAYWIQQRIEASRELKRALKEASKP